MDRMDIQKTVYPVDFLKIADQGQGVSSENLRDRVEAARKIQQKRFAKIEMINCNAQMNNQLIKAHCQLESEGRRMLQMAFDKYQYSARAYHKILKVARTFADLEASENIRKKDVVMAVMARDLEKDNSGKSVI
jgi:magnesium chelatase family protein